MSQIPSRDKIIILMGPQLESGHKVLGWAYEHEISQNVYSHWGHKDEGILIINKKAGSSMGYFINLAHEVYKPGMKGTNITFSPEQRYIVLKSSVGPQYTEKGEEICP
jgi:hypothetical protein